MERATPKEMFRVWVAIVISCVGTWAVLFRVL